MTKPTYKELEDKKEQFKEIAIFSTIMFIGFLMFTLLYANKIDNLNSQLEECKNPQEVWTLKYKCDWKKDGANASIIYTFNDYKKYLEIKEITKEIEETKGCEEIK